MRIRYTNRNTYGPMALGERENKIFLTQYYVINKCIKTEQIQERMLHIHLPCNQESHLQLFIVEKGNLQLYQTYILIFIAAIFIISKP